MSNLVNYKTFGFTKIIPRVASDKFEAVVSHSANKKAISLWNEVCVNFTEISRILTPHKLKDHIYALTPESNLFIGKRSLGHISNYYLGEPISDEEVASVQTAAEALGVDVLNTRYVIVFLVCYRLISYLSIVKNGTGDFTLLVASANAQPPAFHDIDHQSTKAKLKVEYGDFSAPLQVAVNALEKV